MSQEQPGFSQKEYIRKIPKWTLKTVKSFLEEFGSGILTNPVKIIESLGYQDALKLLRSDVLGGRTLIVGEFEETDTIDARKLGKRIIALIKEILKRNPEMSEGLSATVDGGKIKKITKIKAM